MIHTYSGCGFAFLPTKPWPALLFEDFLSAIHRQDIPHDIVLKEQTLQTSRIGLMTMGPTGSITFPHQPEAAGLTEYQSHLLKKNTAKKQFNRQHFTGHFAEVESQPLGHSL